MEGAMSHQQRIVSEFTHQSERFNVSPIHTGETLQRLVEFLPLTADAAWLEVACGTGLVSRALAPRVASVRGIDLTPAMIEVARREAARAGLANARFEVGDATRLGLPAASLDGAVTRFSLHHVPVPGRVVAEMARVVRPGGWVCLADHVTSDDMAAAAWHQEIERLRDPSHWACLTPAQLRDLGGRAGLALHQEATLPFVMSFDEWLSRGSGGPEMGALIERALTGRPEGIPGYRVAPGAGGERALHLVYHLTLWRRPA
jgi:SAM-dependent methyltransferase